MYLREYPFYFRNGDEMDMPTCMNNDDNMEMVNPSNVSPESDMPEYELETMYPTVYYIIYPRVIDVCDLYDKGCCGMNMPSKEDIRQMSNDITMMVEAEVEATLKMGMRDDENRQLGFESRGILRDLVSVLLLREFFQRRHRPHRPRRHMGY
jgi:hypothetical protein